MGPFCVENLNWADDLNDRRFTSGNVFLLANGPVRERSLFMREGEGGGEEG